MPNVPRQVKVRDRILMLIKVTKAARNSPDLAQWIDEIDRNFMDKYGPSGVISLAHLALFEDAAWDFAIVFAGSRESADDLARSITARDAATKIQIMRGIDLDDFTATIRAQTFLERWRKRD